MAKKSAGILLYRFKSKNFEVLLVHPGGPFWKNKDEAAWSIPKGELEDGEDPLTAAIRETEEETSIKVSGDFRVLTPLKQKSGKTIYAWALNQDVDVSLIKSNLFEMEFPPRSGKKISIPEVDKAEWFSIIDARKKIIRGQLGFISELEKQVG